MLVILMGESCSGKTTIEKESGLKRLVSHTTRPKRENETEGIDYYFVSEDDLKDIEMVEKVHYTVNGKLWTYGLSVKELLKAQCENCIVTLNPLGARTVIDFCSSNGIDYKTFYISSPILDRLNRAIIREKSICNTIEFKSKMFDRIIQDLIDFEDVCEIFNCYKVVNKDLKLSVNKILNTIKEE